MRITVERGVSQSLAERFLALYRDAFMPLDVLAAQKQRMDDEEFLAVLADPSVIELVGWEDDQPVAMAVMSRDLGTVPWVSPAYYLDRLHQFPDRSGYYGMLAILVHPSVQGGPWYRAMAEAVAVKAYVDRAVVIFDVCTFNIRVFPMPDTLVSIGAGIFENIDLVEVDAQHYFTLDAEGIKIPVEGDVRVAGGAVRLDPRVLGVSDVIDLREGQGAPATSDGAEVVDLRESPATEPGYPSVDH
jgi:hypothetical protein